MTDFLVPVLPACLPGCNYTEYRIADIANLTDGAHVCVTTVAMLPTVSGKTACVDVVRWFDHDGNTEPAAIEVRLAGGEGLTEEAFSSATVREMAAALVKAGALAEEANRPERPCEQPVAVRGSRETTVERRDRAARLASRLSAAQIRAVVEPRALRRARPNTRRVLESCGITRGNELTAFGREIRSVLVLRQTSQ